ncbi:MAG: hypothetical protein IPK58_07410 [Acidobacteria bacterium]|nr:hypothetical protein [Acidobacteriota bacterium]
MTSKKDARNITTAYAYDALNRVTERSYDDNATLPVYYTYDNLSHAKGKLTKVTTGPVTSPFSITEYTEFDDVGRVRKSRQKTDGSEYYQMEYTYNLSGAMVEEKYPSGRIVKTVLDDEGDLQTVKSQKNANQAFWDYANHFTYTAAGAVSSMQLGNGTWEKTAFNSRLQPTQIGLGKVQNTTDLLQLDYTYGVVESGTLNTAKNNGNIQSQTITVQRSNQNPLVLNQSYVYDPLNRLLSAEETAGGTSAWKQTFSFDRYGNRRFDQANTSFPSSFSNTAVSNPAINASDNRFTSGQGYTYDAAGNVLTDAEGRSFTYDAENKQKEVKNSSNQTIGLYYFDGDGRRVKKVTGSETVIFVFDAAGKLVAEYSTSPSETPQVQYLTNDNLGTPRINTNENGEVVSRTDYMPYGEEIIGLGGRSTTDQYVTDDVRQGFTGYLNDEETNLDYAQARMYKKELGRFTGLTRCLVRGFTMTPSTWNRYSYSINNPLRFTDPTGMVAGDFYNLEGNHIGTDGVDDGRIYIVTDNRKADEIEKTKAPYKGTVESKVEIPNKEVISRINDAVSRSNNSAFTAALAKGEKASGGFAEAGLSWKTTDGKVEILNAPDGAVSDPRIKDGTASISLPGDADGKAHVHQSGKIEKSDAPTGIDSSSNTVSVLGGKTVTTTTSSFVQMPSKVDIANALPGTNIVVGAANKTVYFYKSSGNNSDCNCIAKMSLSNFLKIGR